MELRKLASNLTVRDEVPSRKFEALVIQAISWSRPARGWSVEIVVFAGDIRDILAG